MATNPVSVTIPKDAMVTLTAVANAGWYQRVTLTWPGNTVVFQGSGEGVAMTMPNGQDVMDVGPAVQPYQISALFEFSSSGPNGPFSRARVQNPVILSKGPFTINQITSEDSNDNDNNDTYLTIVAMNFGGGGQVVLPENASAIAAIATTDSAATPSAATDERYLEVHAKSYYNNPLVQGGDEHLFTVAQSAGASGNPGYSGQGWSLKEATYYDDPSWGPLGGNVFFYAKLYNCEHPEMHNLVLTLACRVGYWGLTRPVGRRTANWSWDVTGSSPYTVTRVTD